MSLNLLIDSEPEQALRVPDGLYTTRLYRSQIMSEQSIPTACAQQEVEYRDVLGVPGYQVGSDGSVWSCWKQSGRGKGGGMGSVSFVTGERRKRLRLGSRRYLTVTLRGNGTRRTYLVHHLVAIAFCGPRPEGMEVRHLNDNKHDNRAVNLAWGTPKENAADRDRNGRTYRGERLHTAILTEQQVREIRQRKKAGERVAELAKEFGVRQGVVFSVVSRRTWKHVQ